MSMYDNTRSADGPKKPIEILNDRLDGLINQFIAFNLTIAALNKRVDALEQSLAASNAVIIGMTAAPKAKKRIIIPTVETI